MAYDRARGLDQEEAYRGYLQNCEPVCAHRQTALSALERLANQAELARRDRRLRDDEAFLAAKQQNQVAAFEKYLADCDAECGRADEAREQIEALKQPEPGAVSIPDEVKEKYPELIPQIMKSESMDDKERNYWFSVLPIMTDKQVAELRDILAEEQRKSLQRKKFLKN